MKTIQIRGLGDDAYELLKQRAKQDRRSLQQEAAWLLEQSVKGAVLESYKIPGDWEKVDAIRRTVLALNGIQPDSTSLIRQMRDER